MAGRTSAQKGYRGEAKVRALAERHGLKVERTWGSNGEARGLPREVDLIVSWQGEELFHAQCKNDESIPAYIFLPREIELCIWTDEDAGARYAILSADLLFEQLAQALQGVPPRAPETASGRRKALNRLLKPLTRQGVRVQFVMRNRRPVMAVLEEDDYYELLRTAQGAAPRPPERTAARSSGER